ncbi:hypothetical protein CERZMDRAFT_100556 [Cercospora zeae-maydis SCOH1-5]|uniref:Uncharacterized protein n=1 Tax=Cercospora zeae-maydis SCOH1-5 TaxID=717836 RepID=A0A6A6F7I0_9PEZI|nr:hypothetical protein CERZMDRAFT_100556 [Cercospora zeae-maydis SCOH1-5]
MNKWWSDQNTPITQQPVPIANQEQLMGFEEVAFKSPEELVSETDRATAHQPNFKQENDQGEEGERGEEDDLVVTGGLTRGLHIRRRNSEKLLTAKAEKANQKPVPIANQEQLMGFEEVAFKSPEELVSETDRATAHQPNFKQENDQGEEGERGEEDDLVVTGGLTRGLHIRRRNSEKLLTAKAEKANQKRGRPFAKQSELRVNSFDFVIDQAREIEANAAMAELIQSSIRCGCLDIGGVQLRANDSVSRQGTFAEEIELQDLETGRVRAPMRKETVRSQSTAKCKLM